MLVLLLALAGCGSERGGPAPSPGAETPEPPAGAPPSARPDPVGDADLPPGAQPLPAPMPAPTPAPPTARIDQLCFSPKQDCVELLLGYLKAENQAIDIAIYHLFDSRVSQLLVAKQQAGVRVRVLADRFAYTVKDQHQREMNALASNGVPVRTNRHRGILHHKMAILHGLGLVEHGSMNYTSVASRKVVISDTGQTLWNEENAFFTNNPQVFARFRERFDRMWSNTGDGEEAFEPFTAGMTLPGFEETEASPPTTCYEDPSPSPRPLPDDPQLQLCFAPDQNCNTEVVAPIVSRETRRLDILMFRATVRAFADPLIAKVRAGLPVRIIFDRSQYSNPLYPSMTKIVNDLLAASAAGNLRLKATAHPGDMHMKSVITPDLATWGSGNFTLPSSRRVRGCQHLFYQDEDMAIARDPALVAAMQARFDELWASPDFVDFTASDVQPVPAAAR